VNQSPYVGDVGKKFGHLTLVEILGGRVNNRIAGRWACDCGGSCVYPISRVKSGCVAHCGCRTNHVFNLKHGMRGTPEYQAWTGMKGRCFDPSNKDFPRWGGRGVSVHPLWVRSFEAFYAHIGPRPAAGLTLDRINNTGNYEPGNVRWTTPRSQAENRRNSWTVEIQGRRFASVEEAARFHHVTATTIVRWCDGFTDGRRGNRYTSPLTGCRRWRTY
jgi:hypothetical protein